MFIPKTKHSRDSSSSTSTLDEHYSKDKALWKLEFLNFMELDFVWTWSGLDTLVHVKENCIQNHPVLLREGKKYRSIF